MTTAVSIYNRTYIQMLILNPVDSLDAITNDYAIGT